MFVSQDELLWMLRQLYGHRMTRDKLLSKLKSHGIYSLFPYFAGIAPLFEQQADKAGVIEKAVRALAARINQDLAVPAVVSSEISYPALKKYLLPVLIQALGLEDCVELKTGARVRVKMASANIHVKPGSEGFIIEQAAGGSLVRFYSTAGRFTADLFNKELADQELEVVTSEHLLARHQDFYAVADYFLNDALLRSMRASLDSSVYAFAAEHAVQFLLDNGFLKVDGAELVAVLERIFPVLAPECDKAYRDPSLFSSPTLSSPPSERKAHVLRLELTTGCDYNQCTFCSEYTDMPAETKSFAEFKAHVDGVAESIGAEKSRIQRLFIGSGNSLGVTTELLLSSLDYAREIFAPQKISLYGRTASILEKSADELKRLKDAGLSLIYWGLESGSDEVLNYINKDCTCADMIAAAQKLVEAGIDVSAMLMPGVGGLKFSERHVAGTLKLLHSIDIKYLTLLSINPAQTSWYERNMLAEKGNRHLTPDEVNAQVYSLLEGLQPTGVQIGMFTEEIDQASSNTKRFHCQFTAANKEQVLREFWND